MYLRVPIPASIVAAMPALALALFQVMEWKMPDWMAYTLLAIISASGIIAIMILLHGIWDWSRPIRSRHALRSPFFDSEALNPNQWLLDIAQHDAENPQGELRLISQRVVKWDIDHATMRPWLELGFKYFNGGVHTIVIGPAEGRPKYHARELPDPVESPGRSRLARGATTEYRVKVVLPREVADAVHAKEMILEVARSVSLVRSIILSGVSLEVKSEPADGNESRVVSTNLGQGDTFPVGEDW